MIEAELEQKIITAIRGFAPSDVMVRGAWDVALSGDVKGHETSTAPAFVAVRVSQSEAEPSDLSKEKFPAGVSVVVRAESDPRGQMFAAICGGLTTLIRNWRRDKNGEMREALTPDSNSFRPDGVAKDGGDPPAFDSERRIWTFTASFTIHGHVALTA